MQILYNKCANYYWY